MARERERVGHTGLKNTLKKMNKHETGDYAFCGQEETFERVMLECAEYRQILTLQKSRVQLRVHEILQRNAGRYLGF